MLESPIYHHPISPPESTKEAPNAVALVYSILVQADDRISDGTHDQVLARVSPQQVRRMTASNTVKDVEGFLSAIENHLDEDIIKAGFVLWTRYWEEKKMRMPGWLTRGNGRFCAFTACIMIAAKSYQDIVPSTTSFAIFAGVDNHDLLRVEMDVLRTLEYKILVEAEEHSYWVKILDSYSDIITWGC
jgi:hypothetical protein